MITANALLAGGSDVDGNTSIATASISPGKGRLVLLTVHTEHHSGSSNNIPTATGCGLTWVQVATVDGTQGRLTMLRALGTPTPGAVTIDCAGQTQYNWTWTIDEFINVDPSGANGANAIVQAGTTWQDSPPDNTGISVSLGAFSNLNNATYGSCINKGGQAITHGASFTELENANPLSQGRIESEWANNNQTTVNWTWASPGGRSWAIAVELKYFSASGFFPFL
jgi:hypothetical protein